MKTNRKTNGKTIFLTVPILVLLFAATLIPVSTTLGKYYKELEYPVNMEDFEIPLNEYGYVEEDPTDPGDDPEIFDETPTTVYQVQSGDTLESIAEKFHTTVEAIIACNKLEEPYVIDSGMTLRIPTVDNVIPGTDTEETTATEPPADTTPTVSETADSGALGEDPTKN